MTNPTERIEMIFYGTLHCLGNLHRGGKTNEARCAIEAAERDERAATGPFMSNRDHSGAVARRIRAALSCGDCNCLEGQTRQ